MKDKIEMYQHIPAAVTQSCHAAAVAFLKGFIKCSMPRLQCAQHSRRKSNQQHCAADRPQRAAQSELLLFRTAPGIEAFSSICCWIGLKWTRDTLCQPRAPSGPFSLALARAAGERHSSRKVRFTSPRQPWQMLIVVHGRKTYNCVYLKSVKVVQFERVDWKNFVWVIRS